MVGLGVALSILMFKGFVWLLHNSLFELAKQAFEYMRKLSFVGWLGLGIKLLIFGLSVVGIYALYFAGISNFNTFFRIRCCSYRLGFVYRRNSFYHHDGKRAL